MLNRSLTRASPGTGLSPASVPSLRLKWTSWLFGLLPYLLLVVQPLIFFNEVFFYPKRHIPYDIHGWHFPLSGVLANALKTHQWPFWDPGQYCGVPYFADIQAQLYYPPNLMAVLAGIANPADAYYYFQWLVPIHLISAGLLTFGLLRYLKCSRPVALFGATVFQLGAFFASQSQHLGAVCCGAWLPLCVWALLMLAKQITARAIGLLAAGLTLCLYSGFPAAAVVVLSTLIFLATALVVTRIAHWKLLIALFASLFLSAVAFMVQLAPTLELNKLSMASLRAGWFDLPTGLPLESLVSFVNPLYYNYLDGPQPGYDLPYNFTFLHTYCGHAAVVLLLLIPFARRSKLIWISLAGVLVTTFIMLGRNGVIFIYIYRLLPKIVRGSFYGEYFLLAFTFWVALAATLSLKGLLETRFVRHRPWIPWAIAIGTAINLIAVASGTAMNSYPGSYTKESTADSFSGDKATLATVRSWVNTTTPPLRIDNLDPEQQELRSRAELFGLHNATGDNPFLLLRSHYLRGLMSKGPPFDRVMLLSGLQSPWIDALNIGLVTTSEAGPTLTGLAPDKWEVANLPNIRAYINKSPLPRFYLVGRVRPAKDLQQALTFAADPSLNLAAEAIVEGLAQVDWKNNNSAVHALNSAVIVVEYSNNLVRLKTSSTEAAFLVSSEANYPGWTAEIDGKATPLYQTNVAFRGLPVPAGEHTVVMRFVPRHYFLWLSITALGLFAIAGLFVFPKTFSPAENPAFDAMAFEAAPVVSSPNQADSTPSVDAAVIAAIAAYFCLGLAFLYRVGVEADEVIFVPLLIHPLTAAFSKTILGVTVPLLSMSYLGALKWLIYHPIFALFGMTVESLRLPMMIVTGFTLLLLASFLRRMCGPRAACFTVLLLATDRTFVSTTTVDWGPVALQMFFQAASLFCFVRWFDTRKNSWLFAAGLAIGLGFWDKALFVWFFSSLCLAALILAWRFLLKNLSVDRALFFALGFAIGALPLILYNVEQPLATFSKNSKLALSELPSKATYLKHALNGSNKVWIFTDQSPLPQPQPPNVFTRLDRLNRVRNNGRFFLLILLVPAALFFSRGSIRTWILLLYGAGWIAWLEAAIIKNTGAVHHVVLSYPLWFAALGLAAASLAARFGPIGRRAYAVVLASFTLLGIFQLNSSLADFSRYKSFVNFSDAPPALADFLRSHHPGRVFFIDWGINAPQLFTYGLRLPGEDLCFEIQAGTFQENELAECARVDCLAIGRSAGREIFPNAEQKFLDRVKGVVITAHKIDVIPDTRGVPTFDVFELRPASPQQ